MFYKVDWYIVWIKGVLHEGQAGFRVNRSCMDNVYTSNEIVQGSWKEPALSF